MSVVPDQPRADGIGARIAAGQAARGRAEARLSAAITDLFLPDHVRLDERTRLALARMLAAIVGALDTDIRRHAARILAGQQAEARAEALLAGTGGVQARLAEAGLLGDRGLIEELVARVRCDLIADALPVAIGAPDQASLLVRLTEVEDGVVAAAAKQLLGAETRRRLATESGALAGSELPAELHHRLVWWVAAAIREAAVASVGADAGTDRAIVDAAQRSLAAHDEGDRAEAVAMRLALAIDARADELGPLLVEAVGDRRLTLFIAVLARAGGMDFPVVRALVIEPEGDRLWLMLRAAGLDRATIARIALSLAEADPARDIERFADELDEIAGIATPAARDALAPLTLHADMRRALDALARAETR